MRYEQELRDKGISDITYVNGQYYPSQLRAGREVIAEYGEAKIIKHQYQKLIEFTQLYQGIVVLFSDDQTGEKYRKLMKSLEILRDTIYFYDLGGNYGKLIDGHPSVAGHAEIASRPFTYLTSQQLIACN